MSTYRCQNCGHEFDAGLLFCGKCGAPNQTAQRIHQIEQMLQGEPAPPPGPPKPASAVYPPVPSPAEAVPPPPGPPSIVLQDMAAREPDKGPGRAGQTGDKESETPDQMDRAGCRRSADGRRRHQPCTAGASRVSRLSRAPFRRIPESFGGRGRRAHAGPDTARAGRAVYLR